MHRPITDFLRGAIVHSKLAATSTHRNTALGQGHFVSVDALVSIANDEKIVLMFIASQRTQQTECSHTEVLAFINNNRSIRMIVRLTHQQLAAFIHGTCRVADFLNVHQCTIFIKHLPHFNTLLAVKAYTTARSWCLGIFLHSRNALRLYDTAPFFLKEAIGIIQVIAC